MDPMFQDQRISAYLDGELPSGERAQFEDELARNSELRQLVEELRGLRESLQTLPRHRLDDDFAQQVLRRAERAILAESGASAGAASSENGNGPAAPQNHDGQIVERATGNSISDARRSRRPWIWAAVAVAVAVLLMVFSPPKKPIDLAQKDSSPRAAENPHALPQMPEGKLSARGAGDDLLQPNGNDELTSNSADKSPLAHRVLESKVGGSHSVAGGGRGNFDTWQNANKVADERRELPATSITAGNAPVAAPAPLTPPSPSATTPATTSTTAPSIATPLATSATGGAHGVVGSTDRLLSDKLATANSRMPERSLRAAGGGSAQQSGEPSGNNAASFGGGPREHEAIPAGAVLVAEYAAKSPASADSFKRLLKQGDIKLRGDIELNDSAAAKMALFSAMRTVSGGNLANSAAPQGPSSRAVAVNKAMKSPPGVEEKLAVRLQPADVPQVDAAEVGTASAGSKQAFKADMTAANPARLEVVYVVGTGRQIMRLVKELHNDALGYRRLSLTVVTPAGDGRKSVAADRHSSVGAGSGDGQDAKRAAKLGLSLDGANRFTGNSSGMKNTDKTAAPRASEAQAAAAPAAIAAPPVAAASPALAVPPAADAAPESSSAARRNDASKSAFGTDQQPATAGPNQLPAAAGSLGATANSSKAKKRTVQPLDGDAAGQADPTVFELNRPKQAVGTPPPPAATSGATVAGADSKSAGEPAERSNALSWAARITNLPIEMQRVLRESLAEGDNPPANFEFRSRQQTTPSTVNGSFRPLAQDVSEGEKVMSKSPANGAAQNRSAAQAEPQSESEQVQAVFVFRLAPEDGKPAK